MSSNLHVVLIYDPVVNNLIAEIYDGDIPNFQLPVPYVINGTYKFYRNGDLINQIIGGDVISFVIPAPIETESYWVTVDYTANGIPQPLSISSLVIGPNYIYGNFLTKTVIPGGTILTVTAPLGITPVNIEWARNYKKFIPSDILNTPANGNGVYEISFTGLQNGYTYISAVQVTTSQPSKYILMIGSDGNLYGSFGIPSTVESVHFTTIDPDTPFLYHVYVNNVQYSDNNSLRIAQLNPGDNITILVTDCCGIVIEATTFILI